MQIHTYNYMNTHTVHVTVSYRITQICHGGFLRISTRQLADFREPYMESSQIIHGNIARYPWKHCWVSMETLLGIRGNIARYPWKHCWVSVEPPYVPVECSTEGLPQNVRRRLHSNLCKIYAIPCGLWVAVRIRYNHAISTHCIALTIMPTSGGLNCYGAPYAAESHDHTVVVTR